jgi:amylosucrase
LFYGGVPLIYMGDELGLSNDFSYLQDPTKADDSRWMHRPAMNWAIAASRHDPTQVAGRIYRGLCKLINTRKAVPALHTLSLIQPMWTDNNHVFGLARRSPRGNLMLFANFHQAEQSVKADLIYFSGLKGNVNNLLTGADLAIANDRIYLQPYESIWLMGDG